MEQQEQRRLLLTKQPRGSWKQMQKIKSSDPAASTVSWETAAWGQRGKPEIVSRLDSFEPTKAHIFFVSKAI